MGLNLKPLVTSNSIRIPELVGKVVAVDALNVIYQFLATIRGPTGELLANIHGEPTSHLSGLFYRNINLLCDGVKLVYIFDGKPHELKTKEIERRKKVKEEASEKYNRALEEGRLDDAKKFSQGTSVLTAKMIDESKYLLSLMGIPYVDAMSEGEATAALLSKKELAYSAVSQDYDSILFGAKRLIRNLTISGKRKIPNRNVYVDIVPEIIEHDQVLKINNITHEQLVDIGILIGTDFNPHGFSGIGPKNALKLIQKYEKIEKIEKIISSSIAVKQAVLNETKLLETVQNVSNEMVKALRFSNRIYFCGNGGSAADAQHLAAEFSGRFYTDRKALPAEALHCNTSYLTAVANDYSYDVVYSRLIEGIANEGDIVVGLSTSGNSANIVKAFEVARDKKVVTVAFTGKDGGKMKPLSDFLINVPSTDTPRIQESHIMLGHIICQMVEELYFQS